MSSSFEILRKIPMKIHALLEFEIMKCDWNLFPYWIFRIPKVYVLFNLRGPTIMVGLLTQSKFVCPMNLQFVPLQVTWMY